MPYRLRVVGGPNGSGKTHLTRILQQEYSIRMDNYVNADDIEASLIKDGSFDFAAYDLNPDTESLQEFYNTHPLGKEKGLLRVKQGKLMLAAEMPSMGYVGAVVADFIRRQMMALGITFSFETVMSGSDKILFLKEAKESGYKIYLYFVCTEDPVINTSRVSERVAKGGHDVPEALIIKRWTNSLRNLLPAMQLAHRAYLFDNSGEGHEVVATFNQGELKFDINRTAAWFRNYVLQKLVAA